MVFTVKIARDRHPRFALEAAHAQGTHVSCRWTYRDSDAELGTHVTERGAEAQTPGTQCIARANPEASRRLMHGPNAERRMRCAYHLELLRSFYGHFHIGVGARLLDVVGHTYADIEFVPRRHG